MQKARDVPFLGKHSLYRTLFIPKVRVFTKFFSSSLQSFQQLKPKNHPQTLRHLLSIPLSKIHLPHLDIPHHVPHDSLLPAWPHVHFIHIKFIISHGSMATAVVKDTHMPSPLLLWIFDLRDFNCHLHLFYKPFTFPIAFSRFSIFLEFLGILVKVRLCGFHMIIFSIQQFAIRSPFVTCVCIHAYPDCELQQH